MSRFYAHLQISNDAAIFEIKREIPLEGAKFSSRYEIYNSTTRPFGRSYRELTFSSSASGISSCESQSSVSSSGLSETTTYITCSSEIEPVQMTGFHCIDELSEKHHVSIYNEHSYDDIHEATNYNLEPLRICDFAATESDDNSSERDIVANRKSFAETFTNSASSPERTSPAEVVPPKPLVPVETWSNSGGSVAEPLKSPRLLRQVISDYEGHLLYSVPKSSTKTTYEEEEFIYEPTLKTSSSKTVTKCRSMLNLELKPDSSFSPSSSPTTPSPVKPILAKATSESNLQRDQEKKRIIKTISMMLENRRKRPSSPPAKQSPPPPLNGLPATEPSRATSVTSTVAEAINASLANDNAALSEARRSHTIDRSCRVTGEILKDKSTSASETNLSSPDYHRNVYTLPRSNKSHRSQLQRHFYYPHYVGGKSSTRVPDEELPDPDKVRHARELFEKVLKIGSLENMLRGTRPGKAQTLPPISPIQVTQPPPQYPRPTPEVRQPIQHVYQHPKLQKSLSVDTSHPVTISHCRWMDNGSVSSGVGSDISAETDLELSPKSTPFSRGGSECDSKDDDVMFTSEEDLTGSREAVEDLGKPISADVLSNIRAYGTSVTYYGGKIIASSEGYTCSPMTMTIMNEIKQSSPDYHANRKFLFDDKQLSKYRLIKSNSCGSRLELSGTEEYGKEYEKRLNGTHSNLQQANNHNHQEDHNNEAHRQTATIKEEDEDEQQQQQSKKYDTKSIANDTVNETNAQTKIQNGNLKQNGWCHRKVDKRMKENGKTYCDMEFEEFEVIEESK
ncbi:hypothetical protein V9T40_003263 [Parthenolecanium corni]|uniref:Uncharacterized protein n=1 Tax=Parthenolecanium corni TaxID=536013 RepID=A0AAN9TQ96_9HEMI